MDSCRSAQFFAKYSFEKAETYSPFDFQKDRDSLLFRISQAIKKTNSWLNYDPNVVYRLRFDKSANNSYDRLWNLSTHLVTTRKHIETETYNFNFIFSEENEVASQYKHISQTLPYMLLYAIDIIERAMQNIAELKEDSLILRRNLGFIAWSNDIEPMKNFIPRRYSNGEDKLYMRCDKCKKLNFWVTSMLKSICLRNEFTCRYCGYTQKLNYN